MVEPGKPSLYRDGPWIQKLRIRISIVSTGTSRGVRYIVMNYILECPDELRSDTRPLVLYLQWITYVRLPLLCNHDQYSQAQIPVMRFRISWWRHDDIFRINCFCERNSLHKWTIIRSFLVSSKKQLNKQPIALTLMWRHCNVLCVM